jgi:hypothetical protein
VLIKNELLNLFLIGWHEMKMKIIIQLNKFDVERLLFDELLDELLLHGIE